MEHVPSPTMVQGLLNNLHTLMIAYARAGCIPLPTAPTIPETADSDATLYVECPLEVVLRYFWRCANRVVRMPGDKAFHWLRSRDADERAAWVDLYRTGLPLGHRR